jgi:drug/metabolite transporter (DMT)-like permease
LNSKIKAHIALFLVALIYGANYTIAKDVLDNEHIKPIGFILMRVITGLILFTIIHTFYVKEKVEKKDFFRLLLCGLFGVAINQTFFFSGLKLTTPINASLIMTTTPILVLIASSIMIGEKITIRKILGIIAGGSGAVLLILNGEKINFGKEQILGDLMIFINATSYGIYLVIVKSLMKKYNPITIVKWVFIFGSFFVFPFGASELTEVQWATFDFSIWSAIVYVLFFTTFLAYLFNAYALKTVNPSVVSIYIYLQPLLATTVALIFAKDNLAAIKVISGLLIFAGVYLVSSKTKAKNVTN